MIQIKDKEFVPFIGKEVIEERIKFLAQQINTSYQDKTPIFIPILNGSFMFAADLLKKINISCELCFIRVSSYENIQSSGSVKQLLGLDKDISDRDVVIVEDIIDTGLTMREIINELNKLKPKSIKIAALLSKPTAHKTPIAIDFIGFEIEDKFVVGYGLDYDGMGRNIEEILVLKHSSPGI